MSKDLSFDLSATKIRTWHQIGAVFHILHHRIEKQMKTKLIVQLRLKHVEVIKSLGKLVAA